MSTYSGIGANFDEARKNAAKAALSAKGGTTSDPMVRYKVAEVRGQYGGIGMIDQVEVFIEETR